MNGNNESHVEIFQGRESELSRIMMVLAQTRRNNIILVGESGVGASALLLKLGEQLRQEKQAIVTMIDLEKAVVNPILLLETLEKQLQTAQNNKQIIILDGLESLLGIDLKTSHAILEWIKRVLVHQEAKLVLSCNRLYYQTVITADARFTHHSQSIFLKIPNFMSTVVMVRAHLNAVFRHYHVIVPEEIIPAIVAFAHRYIHDSVLPGSALHLLDASIARVKEQAQSLELQLEDVVNVISQWTGISPEALLISDEEKLRRCAEILSQQIEGQDEALRRIQRTLQAGFLKLHSTQPMAMMLFVGPKSVGKMLTARALAKLFYGSEHYLLKFNMSDYQDAFALQKLLGDEVNDGLLKKMNRYPCAVYVFEGIESAHPQVISELSDSLMQGNLGGNDLSHAIVIMTTESELKKRVVKKSITQEKPQKEHNLFQLVVSDLPGMNAPRGYREEPPIKEELQVDTAVLADQFGEQSYQFMTVIPFDRLQLTGLEVLLEKELIALREKLKQSHHIHLIYSPNLARALLFYLSHDQYTVASIRQLLDEKVLPVVSQTILNSPNAVSTLSLSLEVGGEVICRSPN